MSYTHKKLERRVVETEIRAKEDGSEIEGYAAVFDAPSDGLPFTETIAPGAFKRSIEGGADVLALFNHNFDYVLGRRGAGTLDVAEDDHGLHFRVRPPETTWARDLVTSIRRRDVPGASFGFYVRQGGEKWVGNDRRLLDVELVDVSPVTLPAYSATSVMARGAVAAAELRAAVDLLRSGGVDPDLVRQAIADLLSLLPSANAKDGDGADEIADEHPQARLAVMRRRLQILNITR